MSLRLEKNDTSINVGECFIFKYRGNKCLKGKAVFFIYLDKKSRHSVSQYLTSINVWIKESFFCLIIHLFLFFMLFNPTAYLKH